MHTKQTQSGFGLHGVIALIAVIVIIGLGGWFVWQRQMPVKTDSNERTAKTSNETEPASLIPSTRTGWNTYSNPKLGITFDIPERALENNGAPCKQVSYRSDGYGVQVPSKPNYIDVSGPVALKVFADEDQLYIAPEFTYQRSGYVDQGDGTYIATSCSKVSTDIAAIKKTVPVTNADVNAYAIDMLPIRVFNAASTTDIKNIAAKMTGSDNGVASVTLEDIGKPYQRVDVTCTDTMNVCYGVEGVELHYFTKAHKLFGIQLGNSGHIMKLNGDDFYSLEIAEGVRPL